MLQPGFGLHEILQRRALRAERAAVRRMIGIALDMDDVGRFALPQIALRIHDDAAGHRAIGAGVARLHRVRELEGPDGRGLCRLKLREPESSQRGPGNTHAGGF